MATNAATWFYTIPEYDPFLVTERINATFWQARMVDVAWRCIRAEEGATFLARGYAEQDVLELEWVPGQWLSLRMPESFLERHEDYVKQMTKRIMARSAAITYQDVMGRIVYEWHTEKAQERWSDLQGRAEYVGLRRL